MKKLLICTIAAMLVMSLWVAADSSAWHGKKGTDWVYKGAVVEETPAGVKHYIWETTRPPYGPFDKIALHRFVYEPHNKIAIPGLPARDKRKVLFIIPGTWNNGSPKGSDQNFSENHYFAANGYDVYSMDFRTSQIPNLDLEKGQFAAAGIDISPTAEWTYGVFREDIKTCIEKAKRISRAKKLFLAGRSRGGWQMWMYAAKYWKQDLKGLISLDGGGSYVLVDPAQQWTQAYFEYIVGLFKQGVLPGYPLLAEVDGYEQAQFAGAVPFATEMVGADDLPTTPVPPIPVSAPPDKQTIDFISDLVAHDLYFAWGPGIVTNYYTPYPGGDGETYMDREVAVAVASNFTRYWPNIQNLETGALTNYADCPFLDYDDTSQVDLPILHFASAFGCYIMNDCLNPSSPVNPGQSVAARTASTDVTSIIRVDYGHLDIFSGTHSLEDVKEPMLEWMNERK